MLSGLRLRPWFAVLAVAIAATFLLIGCGGGDATPTPTPTPTDAPTTLPTTTPTITPTDTPTPPPSTPTPTPPLLLEPEIVPARADYWQAPDIYGEPQSGGALRVGIHEPFDTFDVWTDLTDTSIRMRSATHEQLVRLNPYNGTEIIPGLAEGWTIASDNTSITFFFSGGLATATPAEPTPFQHGGRPLEQVDGLAWHNGDPFTCQDALYSVETMWNGVELRRISNSSMASRFAFIDSLECIDAADTDIQALKVNFSSATPNALQAFADPGAFIFQQAWFEEVGEEGMFNDMSVGTGPWIWGGKAPGAPSQTFTKNPNFHFQDTPYPDELVWQAWPIEIIQKTVMEEHESNWTWIRNSDQYDTYVANDNIITVIGANGESAAFWAELEGYYHLPDGVGFSAFDHVWLNPDKEGEDGFSDQTTGWPGGTAESTSFQHGTPAEPTPFQHGTPAEPTPFQHGAPAEPTPFQHGAPAEPTPFQHGS